MNVDLVFILMLQAIHGSSTMFIDATPPDTLLVHGLA